MRCLDCCCLKYRGRPQVYSTEPAAETEARQMLCCRYVRRRRLRVMLERISVGRYCTVGVMELGDRIGASECVRN